ncbi:hypothetical protein Q0F98_00695 [Paenibacillus amylolyticus]|nr:hypothetical protein Q0F98_00695 [Paenibacillus amylolyticus]
MNMSELKTLEIAMSYAPILMFDRAEPFILILLAFLCCINLGLHHRSEGTLGFRPRQYNM